MDDIDFAIQDFYPDEISYCYGCGRLNPQGLHIKTRWSDLQKTTSITCFTPTVNHIAVPGFVYGGLIASLIDCHGTGTAAMAAYQAQNRPWDSLPAHRFVTASLHVDYLLPTPLHDSNNQPIEIRLFGKVIELKQKENKIYKVRTSIVLFSQIDHFTQVLVKGDVIAVHMPDTFKGP